MATLRSPNPDLKVCFRATANPGGPGTTWVKRRYIDPAPLGYKIITDLETGLQRCFIPARAADNKYISSDYLDKSSLRPPIRVSYGVGFTVTGTSLKGPISMNSTPRNMSCRNLGFPVIGPASWRLIRLI